MKNRILKSIFLVVVLCIFLTTDGLTQKQDSYTSSNGMLFEIGDTIVLGVGSAPDGNFNYIYSGMALTLFGALAEDSDVDVRLPEYFHGSPQVIRKIKQREKDVLLLFYTDDWGGFVIDIENAIATCEVSYCRPTGFLTQEEYEKLILMYQAVVRGDIDEEKFHRLRDEMIGR